MPLIEIGGFDPDIGKYVVRFGLDYLSIDHNAGLAGVTYDPRTGFITIGRLPGRTGERLDGLTANAALRTRITPIIGLPAEISGTASREVGSSDGMQPTARTSAGISGAVIGLDLKAPLISNRLFATAFISAGAEANSRRKLESGNFAAIGIGAWWISDPVALNLSLAWTGLRDRVRSPGPNTRAFMLQQTVSLTPSISFAVNGDVTLQWGISMEIDAAPTHSPKPSQTSGVRYALSFGVNYNISDNTMLGVTANAGVGGYNTTLLRFSMSHKL